MHRPNHLAAAAAVALTNAPVLAGLIDIGSPHHDHGAMCSTSSTDNGPAAGSPRDHKVVAA